jgi:hypothetical protein
VVRRKYNMKTKTVASIAVCVLCMLGASSALAGEVNGQGNEIPGGETGRSECSYSGLQDDPVADEGFFRGDRVQSWGQIPKALRDLLTSMGVIPHPSEGCNPNGGHSEEEESDTDE